MAEALIIGLAIALMFTVAVIALADVESNNHNHVKRGNDGRVNWRGDDNDGYRITVGLRELDHIRETQRIGYEG
jgi:hypothetical protein